ncbi:hypothetical protein STEG23_008517, partial [Scotinomys teguina]
EQTPDALELEFQSGFFASGPCGTIVFLENETILLCLAFLIGAGGTVHEYEGAVEDRQMAGQKNSQKGLHHKPDVFCDQMLRLRSQAPIIHS